MTMTTRNDELRRIVWWVAILNAAYFGVEFIVGDRDVITLDSGKGGMTGRRRCGDVPMGPPAPSLDMVAAAKGAAARASARSSSGPAGSGRVPPGGRGQPGR